MQSFGAGRPNGERALVVAIIGDAARDAADGDAAAAAWFLSDRYRWYLSLLGLPSEWLPTGLDGGRLAGMVEGAAVAGGGCSTVEPTRAGNVSERRVMSQRLGYGAA